MRDPLPLLQILERNSVNIPQLKERLPPRSVYELPPAASKKGAVKGAAPPGSTLRPGAYTTVYQRCKTMGNHVSLQRGPHRDLSIS